MTRAANAAAGSGRRGRPFAPGVSGNPKGRAAGSRPLALLRLDAQAEAEAAAVLKAVLDAAKAGDMQAATLVLARIWPARRGRAITGLPSLPDDAAGALDAVLAAIQGGAITPDEGAVIASVIHRRAELRELRDVLDELEKQSP
jgi:hypothetical protein